MPELGKAYVQIVPSAKGISGSISSALGGEANAAGVSAGNSLGSSLVSTLKGVIAAAGIGAAIKSTLDAGGAIQQSFGGLDTIYGDAADAAKEYAYQAAAAGISANDYAEQAVSFGASLRQAYAGDTTKAMEAANTAILDMTDNAAKMGTPLESIQNAYQGFAKQNYTMLDNLKLGYGGTKSEMERLLADATEISKVEYDISNLGDVYEAIHVMQGELGLTGVAAQEASDTFTGSMSAMSAAAQNLLANLATGQDITGPLQTLLGNAEVFILNNLAPMLGNIFSQLPALLDAAFSTVIGAIDLLANNADTLIQQGMDLLQALIKGIVTNVPLLIAAVGNLVLSFGNALMGADWAGMGTSIIEAIKNAFDTTIPNLLSKGTDIINKVAEGITNALPDLLSTAVQIISSIANGILNNLPNLISTAYELVTTFASFIIKNLPKILDAGVDLLFEFVDGIINNLPEIASAATDGVLSFVEAIGPMLPQVLEAGIDIIAELAEGLINAIPKVVKAIPDIIDAIEEKFTSFDWAGIGKSILEGIGEGVTGAVSTLISVIWGGVQDAISWVKSKLGIGSSSSSSSEVETTDTEKVTVNSSRLNSASPLTKAVLSSSSLMSQAAESGIQSSNTISTESIYEAVKKGASAATVNLYFDNREVARSLRTMGVTV